MNRDTSYAKSLAIRVDLTKSLAIRVNLTRRNLLSQNDFLPTQRVQWNVMTKLERSISGDLLL